MPDDGFQQWWDTNPSVVTWRRLFKEKYGEEPRQDVPEYDYRAAHKAGIVPVPVIDDVVPHWDDVLKSDDYQQLTGRPGKVTGGGLSNSLRPVPYRDRQISPPPAIDLKAAFTPEVINQLLNRLRGG